MKALIRPLCYLALGATLSLAGAPAAQAQFPDVDSAVQVDVLPGWREGDGRHMAGLRIRLAPGWKTYWRVPGAGGVPPEFDFSGSQNLRAVQPHMPGPKVLQEGGLTSYGYSDQVVFPLEVRARDASAPIELRGQLTLGVCKDVCIPAEVPLNAVLNAPGAPSPAISGALAARPKPVDTKPTCRLTPGKDSLRLSLSMDIPPGAGQVPVVETADPSVWVDTGRVWREGGALRAEVDLYPAIPRAFLFDRSGLRVTVLSQGRALEMRGCISAP